LYAGDISVMSIKPITIAISVVYTAL